MHPCMHVYQCYKKMHTKCQNKKNGSLKPECTAPSIKVNNMHLPYYTLTSLSVSLYWPKLPPGSQIEPDQYATTCHKLSPKIRGRGDC